MEKREKQQVARLAMLICDTIFIVMLEIESYLLKWETSVALMFVVGTVFCWVIHVTNKLPFYVNLWASVIMAIAAIFFYGSHASSIYDLAAVMVCLMTIYSLAEDGNIINIFIATYAATMIYNVVFEADGFGSMNILTISRILLHVAVVFTTGIVLKFIIKNHWLQRKDTEEKIVELKDANRRTEDFLTNISHELRTPINAVFGITSTMLRREKDVNRRHEILSIQKAGERLFSQVEDVLDFTELDTGRVKISEDSYMISSIVNDIIGKSYDTDNADLPELIVDIDPRIPATLYGDGRKVKKIIKHLIDNGLKFTKEGGVFTKIYAIKKPYGVNLCISVSDTGIGIAPDELNKIKERFYQSNSGRDRKAGGLGLGLSIVCGMVATLEGFVQIDSTLGKGTTVSVSIPQKVIDAKPHIALNNREKLCLACFVKPEKYKMPEVRMYYNEMIADMVSGFAVPLRRISNVDELKQTISMYAVTHLFIGQEEFLENREYLESLDSNMEIVVITSHDIPNMGHFREMRKPFFSLPIANVLNAEPQNEYEKGGSMICPGVRALVVDDEPMNLLVAQGILKGYQMLVKTAKSGMEAIDICSQESFDVIFLDHMMPEMDGIDTLKNLRKINGGEGWEITAIAFTANAVSGAREMFLEAGFSEFLSKPIESVELERVLKKVLPKSSIAYVHERLSDIRSAEDEDSHDTSENTLGNMQENKPENEQENTPGNTQESNPENKPGADKHSDVKEELSNCGIDMESGLHYCGGDKNFYRDVLAKFSAGSGNKINVLDEFYKNKDWGNYRIKIHALKSEAKLIGADGFSEEAKACEFAAKEENEAYILEHHDEVIARYRAISQAVADIVGIAKQQSPTNTQNSAEAADTASKQEYRQIDADEFEKLMLELKDALDMFEENRAQEVMERAAGLSFNQVPLSEMLDGARQDISDFDFGSAAQKVDELLEKEKGGEQA